MKCYNFGEQFGIFKNRHTLTTDSAVPTLDTGAKEMKLCVHTKTCALMSRRAVFVTAKNWRQLKHVSMGVNG